MTRTSHGYIRVVGKKLLTVLSFLHAANGKQYVYCQSKATATMLATLLDMKGYTTVKVFGGEGWVDAWVKKWRAGNQRGSDSLRYILYDKGDDNPGMGLRGGRRRGRRWRCSAVPQRSATGRW